MVPEAKEAMERFKMESASEVGVNLKQGYNGDLTSRQAGSVGGQMVKKMIESYEKGMAPNLFGLCRAKKTKKRFNVFGKRGRKLPTASAERKNEE